MKEIKQNKWKDKYPLTTFGGETETRKELETFIRDLLTDFAKDVRSEVLTMTYEWQESGLENLLKKYKSL